MRERLGGDAPDDFVTGMTRALLDRFPRDEAIELAVDNAATFYLAGHETTANTTAWTLYLLSEQPELQEQAAAEATAALAAGIDADLPDRLPLLRSILEESLRLYPPVPRFDREAIAADRLGEHEIQPGDLVSIWPWIIHRHRKLWDEPDVFDPRALRGRGQRRAPSVPVYAVRGRTQNLRRRAAGDGRGADHPRHLAQLLAFRSSDRASRCRSREW